MMILTGGISRSSAGSLHSSSLGWRLCWSGATVADAAALAAVDSGQQFLLAGAWADTHKAAETELMRSMIEPWRPVLDDLSIPGRAALAAAAQAIVNGSSFPRELLMIDCVDERHLFAAIARHLGLPFVDRIAPETLVMGEPLMRALLCADRAPPLVGILEDRARLVFAVADRDIDIAGLRARLARNPRLAARLRIAAPASVRVAMIDRSRDYLLEQSRHELFRSRPEFSARLVASAWQGALAATLGLSLMLGAVFAFGLTLAAINVVASVIFLACVLARALALRDAHELRVKKPRRFDPRTMPVYSVLVALRKEKAVLPQLLVALGKLQWPRSRLDIKLICEQDDDETLIALRALRLRPNVEIVEVPPCEPLTKPKALAYALPLCRGTFVTLYDAEDRPHSLQLLEAWQRFEEESDEVACLQSPLVITNFRHNLVSRLFGFEYAGLFRGLLPFLARQRLVMPLGGTSNHFRMEALRRVGGWDPYNVTEDADLGLRLKRFGYRSGVIGYPTLEDAPEDLKTWLPQRTRWFKGWLQTWLVHMRSPAELRRDIGWSGFLAVQVLYLGMVLSALVHPVVLATLLWGVIRFAVFETSTLEKGLLILASVNIACGYLAFIALGAKTLGTGERAGLWKVIVATPLYWTLLSVAAWRALWEIYRRPHHWAKTPHHLARRAVATRDIPAAAPVQGVPIMARSSSPIALRSRPS